MDFSAWFEVFLEGRWFTFDARHNRPRINRIVVARGRDAADVAISTSFGPTKLPEAERAVGDREFGRYYKPAPVHPLKRGSPAQGSRYRSPREFTATHETP
jgi:transglutaminase-like putative cysteine protease